MIVGISDKCVIDKYIHLTRELRMDVEGAEHAVIQAWFDAAELAADLGADNVVVSSLCGYGERLSIEMSGTVSVGQLEFDYL